LEGHIVDGRFPLQRCLGAGEESAVFLTQSGDRDPQPAAIKLVLADSRDSDLLVSRWKRAAELSHPHLIRLFHFGTCQLDEIARFYVVMEYAEENLAGVLTERPLSEVEVREMLEPVLDALAYLHREGFVHGHLTPDNIMAVSDQLKISCDGISKAGELPIRARKREVYDPPEFGATGASPAADVWSLGMTVVQAVTQRLPNQVGATLDPVLPETLPAVFSGMVADCLQSDSQKRPTVAAIAARFRQTSSEAEGRNSIPPYDSSRRRPYLLPTAAAGIALAAIVVGTWLVRRSVPSPIPGQTSVQAQPVSKSLPEVDQAEKRANREKEVSPEIAPSPVPPPHAVTPKPSGDSVSGQVTRRVLPNVPQKARDTITGRVTVRVRVSVDPSGRVVSSTLDSAGPSRYFAELALQAARRWEFRPPQVQGHDVSSDWILRFELTRTATEVRPIRVSP